ncbi:EF-hand domain-containing family member B [Trichosurus vulpecula]|uniref:EF-hand domain-containing family member B n=1 Tax=Trichosurus vulpecula TaxID=9337 RepID=UPI00186B0ABC|nr:EF-hand domain-containing family member B [Trichosurus vulpecula]
MEPQTDSRPSAEMGSPRAMEVSADLNDPLRTKTVLSLEEGSPAGSVNIPRLTSMNLSSPPFPEAKFMPSWRSCTDWDNLPYLEKGGGQCRELSSMGHRCPKDTSLLKDMQPQEEIDAALGMNSGLGLSTRPPTARYTQRDPEDGQKMREKLAMQPPFCPKPDMEFVNKLSAKISCPENLGASEEEESPVGLETGLPSRMMRNVEPESKDPVGLVIEPPADVFKTKAEESPKLPKDLEAGVEPPDNIRPIYLGKFFDRNPSWRCAGKLIPVGYRAETCLTEKWPPPLTPPTERKFYKARYPDPGTKRIFYGRADDPDVSHLIHGKKTDRSLKVSSLVNPPPITTFQQRFKERKESIYISNRRAPLGRSHDQTQNLPECLDTVNTTFGVPVLRETTARDIVNPPKSSQQVFEEANQGHDLYVVSHNDYDVGEMKNRKYNPASFYRFQTYGGEMPHFNDGRTMAKSLHWLHEQQMKKGSKIVSKRVDDFNEKFQHKLGKVWDPIAETMNVPLGHTFGMFLRPDDYGAGDLIYNRLPGQCLRGKDREQAVFAAVRQHLKKVNYRNFDTLLEAFRHFDRKGDGLIDKEELQRACYQMNLELDEALLDELFNYCDLDNDGKINYQEFTNFLNWKDKMPIKEFEEKILIRGKKMSEDPQCPPITGTELEGQVAPLIKPEDIVQEEPGKSMKTPRTLSRPTDKVFADYKTSSSQINSVVGGVSPMSIPTCGVPTIRSDIPAPRFRSITDRTDYGDSGNAYTLLHPSIFSEKGVFERDFFKARSKDEIARILRNIGVSLTDENFEHVWNLASKKHHKGEVCVESVRNVLDEMQHTKRIRKNQV